MKREYRVTIQSQGTQVADELENHLRKLASEAEVRAGVAVDVERVETDTLQDDNTTFTTGGEQS